MKKIKPEDVAYELRELSKNTSISPEVINIISHGYARICELEHERDEARRMYCGRVSRDVQPDAFDIAKNHGWDCFPQEDDK